MAVLVAGNVLEKLFSLSAQGRLLVTEHNPLLFEGAFYHSPGLLELADIVGDFHWNRVQSLAEWRCE